VSAEEPTGPDAQVAAGGPRRGTSLLRSSAAVSVGTALSRVTGLVRTLVLAWVLGGVALASADGSLADAYNLANTAPNVVYDLILGGVLAATLVPVLVRYVERDDGAAVTAVSTVVTVVLVAMTALSMLAAPLIIRAYTWGLDPAEQAAQESVAVPLLRLFLPQVLFYGLTALGTALLNAHRRFALAAFAPVLNNVVVIGVLLAFWRMAGTDPTLAQVRDDPALLWLLGLGTTAGIVAMAVVLWPGLRAAGVATAWNPDWRHPAVRRIARLSGWTLGYVLVSQVGFVVLLGLANGTGDGAVTAWSYAYLFFQLPYGLFAVAVMTTFLPELASAFSRDDLPEYRERFVQGIRLILLVVLPSTVLFVVLSQPVVQVLFERGSWGGASTALTQDALATFAAGLPGFALYMYVMRGMYARQDTRTPFWLNLARTVANLALAVPMTAAWGLTGTVASFSVSYTVGALVALAMVRASVGGLASGPALGAVARAVLASAVMAGVCVAVSRAFPHDTSLERLVQLIAAGLAGLAAYLGVLVATGSDDVRAVVARLRPGS
jgi:putative peptidoglycan lipid II flippase